MGGIERFIKPEPCKIARAIESQNPTRAFVWLVVLEIISEQDNPLAPYSGSEALDQRGMKSPSF